jgi:hypothetical protein
MGNKIEKFDDICCYKNIEHQNMDRVNGVTYINPSQPQFLKIPSINTNINTNTINSNILNTNVKQKIEKTIQDNQKITNHSTAMVSKKNSNNNLKSLNLDKNPDDKYFEKEIVINKEALNESINHIKKIFQNNLIEKKKNIIQNEHDLNKKMKIKRNKTEMNKYNSQSITKENTTNSNNENEKISKGEVLSNEKYKKEISSIKEQSENSNEDEMKVSIETINLYSTYTNLNKKNITITSNQGISSSSFYSRKDSLDISKQPKGYFLYKKKKYKFYGNHIQGKKEGFGVIKWNDGSQIKAKFNNSKINGFAQFKDTQFENGLFQGEYKENIPRGYGYYIKENFKIEGDNWEKNHLYGIGMEIWNDDNFYQGEFNKSLKCGIGLYRFPDGTLSLGEWKNNKLNGYGMMKYSNDSIYFGQFKEGLMDGLGEFYWNDTEYYCGYYKEGNKNGFGIYVWNFDKLSCYVGFWENGKQHGIGMKIIDMETKFGFYKDGRKNANLNGGWEIKDYLKGDQIKYYKFMTMNIKYLAKFIIGLKNHENILKEDSVQ